MKMFVVIEIEAGETMTVQQLYDRLAHLPADTEVRFEEQHLVIGKPGRIQFEPQCEAIQMSSQMHCSRCNLTWDCGDHDPPRCPVTGRK